MEEEEDKLDPRIQIELEKLNSSTDVINKLELDLEEARAQFRHLLSDSTRRLDTLAKDVGATCVDRSRAYYDARMNTRKALMEAQHAAAKFEKASSAHEAAKEMVTLAEEGFAEKGLHFDQAWQEMLNHATNRVNESEKDKIVSAEEHRIKSKAYQRSERRVHELERVLKRQIRKSRPYFELKAKFNQMLDDQKRQVQLIEETIQMTKAGYAESLRELEKISEEIHERRQQRFKDKGGGGGEEEPELGERGEGVGAEFPDLAKVLGRSYSMESANERAAAAALGSLRKSPPKAVSSFDSPECGGIAAASDKKTRPQAVAISERSLSLDLQQQICSSKKVNPHLQQRNRTDSLPSKDSCGSSNTASSSNSPACTPGYEPLVDDSDKDEEEDDIEKEEEELSFKMQYLGVNQLAVAGDDLSDTESLTSMEMIDDETIEKLMMDGDNGDKQQQQQQSFSRTLYKDQALPISTA